MLRKLAEAKAAANAKLFWQELMDATETLTGIAHQYDVRTLADLMYLHAAILNGSYIEHFPDESSVLEVVNHLPSHEKWTGYIRTELLAVDHIPDRHRCAQQELTPETPKLSHFESTSAALQFMTGELIATLEDDLNRMSTSDSNFYSDDDRKIMQSKINDMQMVTGAIQAIFFPS